MEWTSRALFCRVNPAGFALFLPRPVLAYAARPPAATRDRAVRAAFDMDRERPMGPIRRGIRPPHVARRLARIPRLPIDLPLPRLALGAAPCDEAECDKPAGRQIPDEARPLTSRSGESAQERRRATWALLGALLVAHRSWGSPPRVLEACSAFTHVAACTFAGWPCDPPHRRLQPLRCLRDCHDCCWLARQLPGGNATR